MVDNVLSAGMAATQADARFEELADMHACIAGLVASLAYCGCGE
jgi:hypothetical protein